MFFKIWENSTQMNQPDEAAVAVQRLRRASQHYLQLAAASCFLVHCGFSEKLGTLGLATLASTVFHLWAGWFWDSWKMKRRKDPGFKGYELGELLEVTIRNSVDVNLQVCPGHSALICGRYCCDSFVLCRSPLSRLHKQAARFMGPFSADQIITSLTCNCKSERKRCWILSVCVCVSAEGKGG